MRVTRLPLSSILDSAKGHLEAHLLKKKETTPPETHGTSSYSGIIFSGNPHESVPRRLLLDNRLSPLERNTWQVFRLLINDDGLTAFPTYDQLRPYLGMLPGKLASRETISKALVLLRLTRWLSLGRRVRNDLSGQVQGNVYLLHDEPVTPAEAMELDKDYLRLLAHSMNHQTKVIREVAQIAWAEFAADPDVGQRLPSRLDVIESRINEQTWANGLAATASQDAEFGIRTQQDNARLSLSSDSELSETPLSNPISTSSSESELSGKSRSTHSVRNPNSYSTYTNTNNDVCKKLVHVQPDSPETATDFLAAMHRLPPDQKHVAVQALQKVPEDLRPALVKQWAHRCDAGDVRNPYGYLLSLVTKAVRGDFNSQWNPVEKPAQMHGDANTGGLLSQSRTPGPEQQAKAVHSAPSDESIKTANQQLSEMMRLLKSGRGQSA